MIMEIMVQCRKICQVETRKLVLVIGIISTAILVSQSFTLPFRNIFLSLFPAVNRTLLQKSSSQSEDFALNPMRVSEFPLLSNSVPSRDPSVLPGVVNKSEDFNVKGGVEHGDEIKETNRDPETGFPSEKDRGSDKEFSIHKVVDRENNATSQRVRDPYGVYRQERARETWNVSSPERIPVDFLSPPVALSPTVSFVNGSILKKLYVVTLNTSSAMSICTVNIKQKALPPTPISEMNNILLRSHVSSCAMRPRWSSKHDQQLLKVKVQIENAPIVENDRELYALVFRNVSQFKRSYEMMESIFKVYIYKEGEKPIFHQPLLKGIYSSEGWFMKQIEGNKYFVTKDPRKAHMFYLPFSSRNLEVALYVPGSHSKKNLVEHLKNYVDRIAAKYPFWNRTGGSDHFLVACHDWAPHETGHNMAQSIRAICNTDLSLGFKIGRDVSLPTTQVRFPQNPLKDIGGKPASQRTNLAFFAGNMHGSLRRILLQHWGNKDPVMKISGPLKNKPSYPQFMKTSKYCLCPKGYEVNSPRVVEAIFYECVPVIISDNYVLPFFEVLDWEAFSVIVAEKDVPLLKNILLSIPEEKYLAMQLRVKKVQQLFLWHKQPVKYDLFHMILHSIWFNRVHQVIVR